MRFDRSIKEIYSSKETALHLGISEASIRNWVRQGYIKPVIKNTNKYDKEEVHLLKNRIESGEIKKLITRANKSTSKKYFIPDELLRNPLERNSISRVIEYILKNNIDADVSLFLLSINVLYTEGIIGSEYDYSYLLNHNFNIPNKKHLSRILNDWHKSLDFNDENKTALSLLDIELPAVEDILGIVYQSILEEGKKAKCGSYYTPQCIIDSISEKHASKDSTFLDPCCGTGQFLLSFAKFTDNPDNIYGIDIDPIAVNIAKINVIIKYRTLDINPKIFHNNTLTDFESSTLFANNFLPHFDIIATNPPWGYHYTGNEIKELSAIYPEIQSDESFSYFLKKSISLLNQNGKIIYVLPEAILNVQIHQDIRKYILDNTCINRIHYLDRVFKNVFSPVIILELSRQKNSFDTIILNKNNSFPINQERFMKNSFYVFDIHSSNYDEEITNKVYNKDHIVLKNNADWALGIVTGNNERFLKNHKIDETCEPVYKGKDIAKYKFLESDTYITYEPHLFQQSAPESKYRAVEKLVYKFISNRLVFAYDKCKRLTLNSANILIPTMPDYDIKLVIAFFNSSLYQFIYQKRFSSIKVLRSHLEQLPLPLISSKESKELVIIVDSILQGEDRYAILDDRIFDLFAINHDEKTYILENIV